MTIGSVKAVSRTGSRQFQLVGEAIQNFTGNGRVRLRCRRNDHER